MTELRHDSVLMQEVLEGLALSPADVVVDGTVGGAGHFMQIVQRLGSEGVVVGIDADSEALDRARVALDAYENTERPTVHLVEDNFRNLSSVLAGLKIEGVTKVLFDLGWSGFQLGGGKGFSFQSDEPLLMTYGSPESSATAAELVNSLPEKELADLIYTYGEEHNARRIAKAIVDARRKNRILTTLALSDVVATAVHSHGRINPATKTFQALRIAVNDEFGALKEGLEAAFSELVPGGRLAIISFHSTEDRIVKEFFRDRVKEGNAGLVYKKPIAPGAAELLLNRRSRSAKLRVLEKRSREDSLASDVSSSLEHSYA
jgi:16S rRNA (cytosine1402-N4)-methyltransferase